MNCALYVPIRPLSVVVSLPPGEGTALDDNSPLGLLGIVVPGGRLEKGVGGLA